MDIPKILADRIEKLTVKKIENIVNDESFTINIEREILKDAIYAEENDYLFCQPGKEKGTQNRIDFRGIEEIINWAAVMQFKKDNEEEIAREIIDEILN